MRKSPAHLIAKLFFLFAALCSVCAFQQALTPIDSFTFRCWEALRVFGRGALLPGPYYPRQVLHKIEQGDLGHHSPDAVEKDVVWKTDRFGYRNQGIDDCLYFPVVLLGDSTVVSTGVTQSETLAERLKPAVGRCVFAMAPSSMTEFLRTYDLIARRPRLVVFTVMERDLLELEDTSTVVPAGRMARLVWPVAHNPFVQRMMVFRDRILRGTLVRYLDAHGEAWLLGAPHVPRPHPRVLFYQGDAANVPRSASVILSISDRLAEYRNRLKELGIELVVMPVPNKESIAFDQLPSRRAASLLPAVYAKLAERQIPFIDLLEPFQGRYRQGQLLYLSDDSHLNAEGIRVAAEKLLPKIAVIANRGLAQEGLEN